MQSYFKKVVDNSLNIRCQLQVFREMEMEMAAGGMV